MQQSGSLALSSSSEAMKSWAVGSWYHSVLFIVTVLVLHIWGDGMVRRPVGLILLMPPSRMQILGYFIFTRCAANWKKKGRGKFIEDIQNLYFSNPIFSPQAVKDKTSLIILLLSLLYQWITILGFQY